MVSQAGQRYFLRARLHWLTLPLATLNNAASLLIEIDEVLDCHFAALGLDLFGRVFPQHYVCEDGFRFSTGLFCRDRSEATYSGCPLDCSPTSPWPVLRHKGLPS